MTHFSLFSGIGGLDLAAEWAGFETIGQVEKDSYCRAVLETHWPGVPRWEDIADVTADALRDAGIEHAPTVLSGGFPCQPFSCAGQRKGPEDDRYLWPEMLRVVRLLRPAWVVGENVAGFVSMALDDVCADLERAGYACRPFLLPAASVGAPHMRDRVFVVAYATKGAGRSPDQAICTLGEDEGSRDNALCGSLRQPTGDSAAVVAHDDGGRCPGSRLHLRSGGLIETPVDTCRGSKNVSLPPRTGREERHSPPITVGARYSAGRSDPGDVPHTDLRIRAPERQDRRVGRFQQSIPGWGGAMPTPVVEPGVRGMADGLSPRVDRLRALGNAVVPQQAYPVFRAIARAVA